MSTDLKKGIIFALRLVVSFLNLQAALTLFDNTFTTDNTPPMPIHDAHLGGFLVL